MSFQTRGAEKVGIVGRTGSGKSSIFQALYRLAEIDRKETSRLIVDFVIVLIGFGMFIPDPGFRAR